jgi:hypothetical protein
MAEPFDESRSANPSRPRVRYGSHERPKTHCPGRVRINPRMWTSAEAAWQSRNDEAASVGGPMSGDLGRCRYPNLGVALLAGVDQPPHGNKMISAAGHFVQILVGQFSHFDRLFSRGFHVTFSVPVPPMHHCLGAETMTDRPQPRCSVGDNHHCLKKRKKGEAVSTETAARAPQIQNGQPK